MTKAATASWWPLKSVDTIYPLRGRLQLGSVQPDGTVKPERVAPVGGPIAGACLGGCWGAAGLESTSGRQPVVGDKIFPIEAVIATEPDRGAGFMTFAPRVMIRLGDFGRHAIGSTRQPVTYRLLTAGAARPQDAGFQTGALLQPDRKEAIDRFVADTQKAVHDMRGVRVETMDQGGPKCARPWIAPVCFAPGGLAGRFAVGRGGGHGGA